MSALAISIVVAISAFTAGILGLYLQKWLPERHTTDRSRDMISSMVALVSLVLALVLGTLVSSSFGAFSTQESELETLATNALDFDLALTQYGPDGQPSRDILRESLVSTHDLFWGRHAADTMALGIAAALPGIEAMNHSLDQLEPKTPMQKALFSSAISYDKAIEATRLKMSLQLASTVAPPLLLIIGLWSVLLFLGYGLLSRVSAMTVAVLGFGALSVAGAIFLIVELHRPYSGLIHVPPAALLEAIHTIAKK
jgi:hypothetical protein